MTISVVIPTYKRYNSLNYLLSQLSNTSFVFKEIIVVDSTDEKEREDIIKVENLILIYSSHKNGVYQRYLGYNISTSDLVLFLDNDMEIMSPQFAKEIIGLFTDEKIIGAALNFVNKHTDTTLAKVPTSILNQQHSFIKFIKSLSGYPTLPPGKTGYCGIRGKQPENGGPTEWLSGGAFVVKKGILFRNYNFQIFDLFEDKKGMGEDFLWGLNLSKQGVFLYYPKVLFYHNDQKDSAYSSDYYSYGIKSHFSRLYLSLEKARIEHKPLIFGYVYYYWYSLWRILGLLINLLFRPSNIQKLITKGAIKGLILSITNYKYQFVDDNKWRQELEKDFTLNSSSTLHAK